MVRRIFQLYVEEGLSMEAIARYLTAQQIPTRQGAPQWHRSVVWGMLRKPAYQGQAAYRTTQAVARTRPTKAAHAHRYYPKGVHASTRQRPQTDWLFIAVPPMISPRLFAHAGRQLEANKRQAARNTKRYEYLLRGRLRCQSEYRKYKATFHASTSAGATGGSPSRASLAQSAQAAGRRRLALRAGVG
jgi:site-specific DNA recombinase